MSTDYLEHAEAASVERKQAKANLQLTRATAACHISLGLLFFAAALAILFH